MKKGVDFILKDDLDLEKLEILEGKMGFNFPSHFKSFVSEYSFSNKSIILEMKVDELRGFEFPAEAVLYEPSKTDDNPLFFSKFRNIGDLEDDIKLLDQDELWIEKGLLVIGYSTVGEKICLGIKEECMDEIWRVNDDSIRENMFKFLAENILSFVNGLISKKSI